MRRVLPVLLVACGSPADAPRREQRFVVTPSDAGLLAFGAKRNPVVASEPSQLANGRHGDLIELLVADGVAVVSVDTARHARLWPTLDGTREPWALPLSQPVQVAVESGGGFGVAAIDSAGTLEVLAVDDDGRLTSRAQIDSEHGFDNVESARGGFLALRRDQVIEWIDRTGTVRASLVGQSGERVVRLLRGTPTRVLALVAGREGMRGRWLEIGDTVAWGATTPVLAVDPTTAFLSPDLRRIVGMRPLPRVVHEEDEFAPRTPVLVDVQTGSAAKFGSHLVDETAEPIGFASPNEVVLALPGVTDLPNAIAAQKFQFSMFTWVDLDGVPAPNIRERTYDVEEVFADHAIVADGRVIAPANRDLAIVTRKTFRYLGYRSDVTRLRATPASVVANGAVLDDKLHATTRVPASSAMTIDSDLALVRYGGSDPDWLEVIESIGIEPRRDEVPHISIYDLAHRRELQSLRIPRDAHLAYEPTTKLVVIAQGTKLLVTHVDGKKLPAPTAIVVPAVSKIVMLDPARANGNVAITVHGRDVRTWTQQDLATKTVPAPAHVDGVVEAIDRVGHLYVRGADGTVAFGDSHIADHVQPSPDGKLVASFAKNTVRLFDEHGERWSVAMVGVSDVAWTPGGDLLVVAQDLAQLSLVDGKIVAAQCGWAFGLHAKAMEHDRSSSTLCDR